MGVSKYERDGDPRTSGPGFRLTTHEDALTIPLRWTTPRTIFVNSMSDLFHAEVPDGFIRRVFEVMERAEQHTFQILTKRSHRLKEIAPTLPWPGNVWMGVSIESTRYTFRADHLRGVPAHVRFLSLEPLLGPLTDLDLTGIHWVIVGGESGPGARPVRRTWVRDIRRQCNSAGVPFFFKQWGGRTPKAGGRVLDGRTYDRMPQAVKT
jgi:protein gp37